MALDVRAALPDTSATENILKILTGRMQRREENAATLRNAVALALAQKQIEAAFPNAEEQAKQQAAQLIQQLNPEPVAPGQPTISVSPQTTFTPSGGRPTAISPLETHALTAGGYADQVTTPESRTNRFLDIVRGRQQTYQTQVQDRKARILDMMQERGLLNGRSSGTTFYLNPSTGTASPITTPEGKIVQGKVLSGGYAGVTPKEDIVATVEGIKSGDIPPDPTQISFRDRTRVNAELERNGINLTKLRNDWTSMQAFARNANSSMQLRMRQALESVGQGIETLRQLSQDFSRTGWTPANAVVLKAALTGTDPTRRDQATKFLTQLNVMKDELAQGFMGGGVPTDRAFKLADEVMHPLYGDTQLNAALDQLRTNLNIRLNAINSLQPIYLNQSQDHSPQLTPENKSIISSQEVEATKARLRAKYGR